MTEWTAALQQSGYSELAKDIDTDKITSLQRLEALGLPQYERLIVPVSDFLQSPDTYFDALKRDAYFTILTPKTNQNLRYRTRAARDQVVPFIDEHLSEADRSGYHVILEEFLPQKYGGNVVCQPDGSVYIEMIEGETGHNRLVGGENPEFTMTRNPYSGRFAYSFEDSTLRQAMQGVVAAIPHEFSEDHSPEYQARGINFPPGYYEFYLVERSQGAPLEPIFIDYSDQPAYLGGHAPQL